MTTGSLLALSWVICLGVLFLAIFIRNASQVTYTILRIRPIDRPWRTSDWVADVMEQREWIFFDKKSEPKYFYARGRGAVWRDMGNGNRLPTSLEDKLENRYIIERWQLLDEDRKRHN